MNGTPLSWFDIARLGLVQAALGAIVVLTTSTINRIMVVELALPAVLPGALVTLHYALQVLRPRFGHGSDGGKRRTPWIVGGMALLALGGFTAACATALMAENTRSGIGLAVIAFAAIGAGVGAAGTALLTLLASRVAPARRAAAAMTMWMMMIAGIAVTAITAGHFLDPYSPARLVEVAGGVAAVAFLVTLLALFGVERGTQASATAISNVDHPKPAFAVMLRQVWAEPEARAFTIFVFVAMVAYSAQDLILEPFAGTVFGLSPADSTKLSGLQHGGVFAGMALAGLLGSGRLGVSLLSLRGWTIVGCVASGFALLGLTAAAISGPPWPLSASVFALGTSNGVFAVAAIGSMMMLAGEGRAGQEGLRVGLWGAAQAFGFATGGFLGTVAVDSIRALIGSASTAYAVTFGLEALLFLVSARLAFGLADARREGPAWAAGPVPGVARAS